MLTFTKLPLILHCTNTYSAFRSSTALATLGSCSFQPLSATTLFHSNFQTWKFQQKQLFSGEVLGGGWKQRAKYWVFWREVFVHDFLTGFRIQYLNMNFKHNCSFICIVKCVLEWAACSCDTCLRNWWTLSHWQGCKLNETHRTSCIV